MKRKTRLLSLILALAMILSCAPLTGLVAFAATDLTALYIIDTVGGTTVAVDVDNDVTDSEHHWSWNATSKTLTLGDDTNGFAGERIVAEGGDLNIVLKGENTITLPADGYNSIKYGESTSTVYGIYAPKGSITISSDGTGDRDTLTIGQSAFTNYVNTNVYMVYAFNNINIETGVDVSVVMAPDSSVTKDKAPSTGYKTSGFLPSNGETYIKGDSNLTINLSGIAGAIGFHRGCYAQTSGDINITFTNKGYYSYSAFDAISSLYASGTGKINVNFIDPVDEATNKHSNFAIDYGLVVETTAGDITFTNGIVNLKNTELYQKYNYYVADGKVVTPVSPTGATTCVMGAYEERYYSVYSSFIAADGTNVGKPITSLTIKNGSQDLAFVNPSIGLGGFAPDMMNLKVGTAIQYADYSSNWMAGYVIGGTPYGYDDSYKYEFSIAEGYELPDGLSLSRTSYNGWYISGTPTKECSGTTRIVVKDSVGTEKYIDVDYKVSEPDRHLTIDGVVKVLTKDTDESGTGWSFDYDTATLTLDNYSGGVIGYDFGDLNIVLKGTNTITLPADGTTVSGTVYGINVPKGSVTISSDGTGERDTLTIGQSAFTNYSCKNIYMVYAFNDINIETGVDVSVVMAPDSSVTKDKAPSTGYKTSGFLPCNGETYIKGDSNLTINLSGIAGAIGFHRGCYAQTSGDINITFTNKGYYSYSAFDAISSLYASGTGKINVNFIDPVDEATNKHSNFAIDYGLVVETTAGDITFTNGIVNLKNTELYQKYNYYVADGKVVTPVSPTGATTCVMGSYEERNHIVYSSFIAADGTNVGKPITSLTIKNGSQDLAFVNPSIGLGGFAPDMMNLKVGTAIQYADYTANWMAGYVIGGTPYGYDDFYKYEFSIAEGYELPDGLSLNRSSYNGWYISGTPTKECNGTTRIVVKDSVGTEKYIDVPYSVTYKNPVTGVTLNKSQKTLDIGDTDTLAATVAPENASVTTVGWSSSDNNVATVSSTGVVTAVATGKATITVKTTQGGLTATCDVYVREAKPTATIVGSEITGLVANANYLINGTDAVTADAEGKVELKAAWFGNDITIVKTNDIVACNSEAQTLEGVAGKYILAKDVTLEKDSYYYTGSAIEATVTVKDGETVLTKDTDYTVAYSNNVSAGTATVTVTGKGTYSGSTSKTFTILKVVDSIDVETNGGKVPNKLQYMEDTETLDLSKGKLYVRYTDGSTALLDMVTDGVVLAGLTYEGFDNSEMVEGQEITLKYNDGSLTDPVTATFKINIIRSAPTSIEMIQNPTKTSYLEAKDTLDVTGGRIQVNYDGYDDSITLNLTADMVTGFDNTVVGKQTLTVTYGGRTTTFDVDIVAKSVSSIAIKTRPEKYAYLEGDKVVNIDGGVLTVNYNNGTSEDIAMSAPGVTVSGIPEGTVYSYDVTVTYKEKTTTFNIYLNEKVLESIKISTLPTKTSYCPGEALDVTGGKLKLTYNNGTTEIIDMKNDMIAGFSTYVPGTIVLQAIYETYYDEFNVTIKSTHNWNSGKVTKAATCTTTGVKTYTCSDCGATKTETIAKTGHTYVNGKCSKCSALETGTAGTNNRVFSSGKTAIRYYGETRYKTCLATAEALKTAYGVSKFDNIVVVAGFNFPDALSATYLAAKLKAPIIMVNTQNSSTDASGNINYIINNFSKSGKIYMIGGTAAISSSVESTLKSKFSSAKVERIYGQDRYETNAKVLQRTKELGLMSSYDLLVCSGAAFPDALSCSGLGKPIMLVNGGNATSLTSAQKSFVSKASNVYIIGGNAAVNSTLESAIKSTGKLKTRLSGNDRYETSQKIANYFCSSSQSVVLASGLGFADGLCGGSLAYALGAPVMLTRSETANGTSNTSYTRAKAVVGSKKVVILGGSAALDNSTAQKIKSASIKENKYN